jgi:hypothetical protein
MFHRLIARASILILVIGLCLTISGCGSKITKANADKINTGMSEKEVSDILGSPTETAEVEMPDLGGLFGAMTGGAVSTPNMPKKARQSTWKEGDKVIAVTFVDGKVVQKVSKGF